MRCGYATGLFHDPVRQAWTGDGPRPIRWSAWYPTLGDAEAVAPETFFDLGAVLPDAPIDPTPRPVVLLSHGTGGVAESLAWLARALVGQGYIVIGVNHHGNTGAEPYLAAGFLCWWERATDLSRMLDHLTTAGPFKAMIDPARVACVGFSLGGYTALSLAGARTSMEVFNTWAASLDVPMTGPKEFLNLTDQFDDLMAGDAVFQATWARHDADYADPRITSFVSIAAAPPVRGFTGASVAGITQPVTLIASGADTEAPRDQCSDWLADQNPGFAYHDVGDLVGHYTFLNYPRRAALKDRMEIFQDHPTVVREDVWAATSQIVMDALARDLT